jgi:hypothetical protein
MIFANTSDSGISPEVHPWIHMRPLIVTRVYLSWTRARTLNDQNVTGEGVVILETRLAIEIPGIYEFTWCSKLVPQVLSVDSICKVATHSWPTLIWLDFLNYQIGRPGRFAIFRRDELEMGSSFYPSLHLQPTAYKVRL